NDHHRDRKPRPGTLAVEPAADGSANSAPEQTFLADWRQDLLDQAWESLREDNPAYHAVLLLRIENPDIQSPELAARAGEQLERTMTPENARKALQRAHTKFAALLLDRVADSLHNPTDADLEAELKTLDLLKYCRTALAARHPK